MKVQSHMKLAGAAIAGALALACTGAALAQAPAQPPGTTAYSITYVEALPHDGAKADRVLQALAAKLRKGPGNLSVAVLQRIGREEDFALVEMWKDQAALDASDADGATKATLAELAPLLRSPADERVNVPSVVNVARMQAALASQDPNYIFSITHADVIPAVREAGLSATRGLGVPSSAQPGNVAYDVLQQASRMNHVTLLETWKDRKSFDDHDADSGVVAFRNTFRPLSGSLYDQRLYRVAP